MHSPDVCLCGLLYGLPCRWRRGGLAWEDVLVLKVLYIATEDIGQALEGGDVLS